MKSIRQFGFLEQLEPRRLLALVAAYGMNEGIGTTIADASGTGNNGAINGATWSSSGKFGSALSFNGSSSVVTINDSSSLQLTGAMTLEAWVRPAAAASGFTTVLLKERSGGLCYSIYASDGANRPPSGYINRNNVDQFALGSTVLPLNTWSHLAATYDGANIRLYVNAAQVGTKSISGNITTSNGALRIGGNSVWGEYFNGLIDEVRIYNTALSQSQIQTDMNTAIGSGDTTPPVVSMTAPTDGALVSGTVTLSANASDDVAVAGVQFLLDGQSVGLEDTTAPYSVSWESSQASNGQHALAARAHDTAGNVATSTAVTVTISNSNGPDHLGQWSAVAQYPLVDMHMALLKTGKILMWDGGPDCIGATSATVFDPATGTFTPTPSETQSHLRDLFCSGLTVLADGRVLVAGGHECDNPSFIGLKNSIAFDPVSQTWTHLPDMAFHRWYPTATTLPDGRALVTAGADTGNLAYVPIPEVYNPVANTWTKLTQANRVIPDYPFMFVLPDGRVLAAASDEAKMPTSVLNVATQTWSTVDSRILDAGSAAMYLPGKIMKAGASYLSDPPDNGGGTPSSATTYVIDMNQASPAWQQTAPMAFPRTHLNLTILPDGNVLATGGSTDIGGVNPANSVYAAEMWSPATQTWKTMSSMQTPRLYHSTALLLPDGRVLVAGGGHNYFNNIEYPNAEYFSPAYLFKGARPTITSVPSQIQYGKTFSISTPNAAGIASVALIRNGAVTHSNNMDQRYVPLTFQRTAGGLNIQAPATSNLAPPGYYMLFVVNSNGVPSIAPFVSLPVTPPDTQAPTAPTNLAAKASSTGRVSLTWNASTDNVEVAGYDVYRSTVNGFIPSDANRIAQILVPHYTDRGLASGTYYYRAIARDAAGNKSAPSNQASAQVVLIVAPPDDPLPESGGASPARTAGIFNFQVPVSSLNFDAIFDAATNQDDESLIVDLFPAW